jgi:hypothetical protein
MLRAFLVAPIGAAFVYTALLLIDPFDGRGAIIGALWIVAAVVIISYLAEAVIAWPAFLLLVRLGWANPVVSIIGGLMLGVLLAGLLDLPDLNFVRWRYYMAAGLSGACSGAVFSYMMFWRPNNVCSRRRLVRSQAASAETQRVSPH